MKQYLVSNERSVVIMDLHEALVEAGSSETDNPFHQDQALYEFFGEKRVVQLVYDARHYDDDITRLIRDGVEIIILIKDQNG